MMKTKFMVEGSNVSVVKMNEETALDYLPPKVYSLQFSKLFGYYLSIVKDYLQVPSRIYGDAEARAEKCIQTYRERNTSTGILMTGDKGTGKTLLTSLLANKVISDLKLPVILITEPHKGEQFASFIETVGECCLIFDEFGKMYSSRRHEEGARQEDLLSLMDGVDKTKRLIIMTENSSADISEFLLNRPSRVYYHFRYSKLDESSIKGYCDDHNVSAATQRDIIELSRRSKIFSFDMLQSIVEEHARFNTGINEVIADLNIDIRQESDVSMEIIKVISKADGMERELLEKKTIVARPLFQYTYAYVKLKPASARGRPVGERSEPEFKELTAGGDDEFDEIHFEAADLAYESMGNLVFETEQFTIVAKELPRKRSSYFDLF